MEKIILNFLNYLKENWILFSSFVVLSTTLFCIYISSSIFQLWEVSYLKYIDFSEVYSFTLDSIGLKRSLNVFMLIITLILQWVSWFFMFSNSLEVKVAEKKISNLIYTNSTESAQELLNKSEDIKRGNFVFSAICKPQVIMYFIVCSTLTYHTFHRVHDYVDEYEKNTENYKHFLKTNLTIKDQEEKVCGYVIYSNNNKIIFVECETKKLTKVNQRFVISSTSEAKT